MKRARRSPSGFTLIELMVVVTILAVLSIVAITSYKYYTQRAYAQEGRQLLMEVKMKQEQYFATYSEYVTAANGAVAFGSLFPAQKAKASDGSEIEDQFDWSEMDCANTGGNVAMKGFCDLGFQPQGDSRWRVGTWGWSPASPALPAVTGINGAIGGLISNMDTTQRWYVAVAMRPNTNGQNDAATGDAQPIIVMTSQHNEIIYNEVVE
ncbi:MAG: prepilin-type N-terminal cleavage/methylation domain-containing protein [Myxococcota bacterium]|jgi:prepilin-type N-terminal cleavage/methylation domain-containing protein